MKNMGKIAAEKDAKTINIIYNTMDRIVRYLAIRSLYLAPRLSPCS